MPTLKMSKSQMPPVIKDLPFTINVVTEKFNGQYGDQLALDGVLHYPDEEVPITVWVDAFTGNPKFRQNRDPQRCDEVKLWAAVHQVTLNSVIERLLNGEEIEFSRDEFVRATVLVDIEHHIKTGGDEKTRGQMTWGIEKWSTYVEPMISPDHVEVLNALYLKAANLPEEATEATQLAKWTAIKAKLNNRLGRADWKKFGDLREREFANVKDALELIAV